MDGTEPVTTTATPEALQAYQYKIARSKQELEKQMALLDERRAAAASSSECMANLSRHSRTSGVSHRNNPSRVTSRLANVPEADRENLIQNLDMSFMSIDTRGNFIPKTPEVGYMATRAFLMASRPPKGDPRASLYQMAMAEVGVMGAPIVGREVAPQPESAPRKNSPRQNCPRPTAVAA
jgi:hypothetical protein